MSTDAIKYIDVSKISERTPGAYISVIAREKHPVLVFMPMFEYDGMEAARDMALKLGIKFVNVPITLPIMDLVHQMEYGGIEITQQLVLSLQDQLRETVIRILNEKPQ